MAGFYTILNKILYNLFQNIQLLLVKDEADAGNHLVISRISFLS